MASSSGQLVARFVLSAACIVFAPSLSFAQTETERAGARAAAEAGLSAYNGGRYAEAYDLLSRAETLVHALPHQLYMARASEKQGQLVRAREIYLKMSREQLVAGAPRAFIDAQQSALQELQAIDARLPYLTVTLEGASGSEVRVTMDEKEVPSVLLGVPFPADPGNHVIVATGQGIGSEPLNIVLSEGKRDRVTLRVIAKSGGTPGSGVPDKPAEAAPTSNGAVATTGQSQSPSHDPGTTSATKPPILAYSAIGLGAVGVGLGTVFLLQRSSLQSDGDKAFDECKSRVCSQNEIDAFLDDDKKAARAGTWSVIGYGVGAAALSAGIYLLLTHDSKPKTTAYTTRLIPYIGPTQAGATLTF
jgi:hypothetical protein